MRPPNLYFNVALGEVTLAGTYKFTKMFQGRAEFRQDWANRAVYKRGSQQRQCQSDDLRPAVALSILAQSITGFAGGGGRRNVSLPVFFEMHFPMTGSLMEILQNPRHV